MGLSIVAAGEFSIHRLRVRDARICRHARYHAKREKLGEDVRAAITHEWNGRAGHRQHTHVDADMQCEVRREVAQDADGKERFKI